MTHVREAVRSVVVRRASFGDVTPRQAEDLVLISVAMAMGVGLFGHSLAELMGKAEGRTRKVAVDVLRIYHAAQRKT